MFIFFCVLFGGIALELERVCFIVCLARIETHGEKAKEEGKQELSAVEEKKEEERGGGRNKGEKAALAAACGKRE